MLVGRFEGSHLMLDSRPAASGKRDTIARKPSRACLRLEALEARLAPASFFVNAQLEISRLDCPAGAPAAQPSPATPVRQVVFFESSVADYQALSQGLGAETDAVVLDGAGDGLQEMAALLAGRHDLAAIGVVAHGTPGSVLLGATALSGMSLNAHVRELAVVGSALAPGGELDLWSCDVAAGPMGESLLGGLAVATGARVAAADHAIGSAPRGGDWELNVRVGEALRRVHRAGDH